MKVSVIFGLAIFLGVCSEKGYSQANITVRSDYLTQQDTLVLCHYRDLIGAPSTNPSMLYRASMQNGQCTFEVDSIGEHSRFSLFFDYQKLDNVYVKAVLPLYPISAEDDIVIDLFPQKGTYIPYGSGYDNGQPVLIGNWKASFSGHGADKYSVRQEALEFVNEKATREVANSVRMPIGLSRTKTYLDRMDSLFYRACEHVDRGVHLLTEEESVLIKADALGMLGTDKHRAMDDLYSYLQKSDKEQITVSIDSFKVLKKVYFDDPIQECMPLWKAYLHKSSQFQQYFQRSKEMGARIEKGNINLKSLYDYLLSELDGSPTMFRDRVMGTLLVNRYQFSPDPVLFDTVFRRLSDPYTLQRVGSFTKINPGSKATFFRLPDGKGTYHSLEDYKGKVVFMDFWYMGCIPCRQFMKNTLRPVSEYFANEEDVVFITISIDKEDVFSKGLQLRDFLPDNAIHLFTDNLGKDHPLLKNYAITGYPFPILIDRNGYISKSGIMAIHGIEEMKTAITELL